MELVTGRATVEDVDEFLSRLQAVGREHGVTVQAFDARYVVDREHLQRAVALADRAIERDEAIADDRAMEILCYAAGTRQIQEALSIGVSRGETSVVVLVDDPERGQRAEESRDREPDQADSQAAAASAIEPMLDVTGDAAGVRIGAYDEQRVRQYFDVGEAELAATDAGIPALVRERVALLVVER